VKDVLQSAFPFLSKPRTTSSMTPTIYKDFGSVPYENMNLKRVTSDNDESNGGPKRVKLSSDATLRITKGPIDVLQLEERWDREALDNVLRRHELFTPSQISLLEGIQRGLGPEGELKVEYRLSSWSVESGFGGGRRYGRGAQRVPSWVRRVCTHKYYVDLDISNCHPEVFVQLCLRKGIDVKHWQYYCKHREECLLRVDRIRKAAKKKLLLPLFGCENLKGYLGALSDERNRALEILWVDPEFSGLRDSVMTTPAFDEDGNKKNPKDTFLSYVLSDIEWMVVSEACKYLASQRAQVDVNCFDGVMVRRESLKKKPIQDLLAGMNKHCKEKTGFVIKFEEKSLKPRAEDLLLLRHCFNDHRQVNETNFDRIYNRLRALPQQLIDEDEVAVEDVRREFTRLAVVELNKCFAYVRGSRGEVYERMTSKDGEIRYVGRSEKCTRDMFSNKVVIVPVPVKNDSEPRMVPVKILDMWFDSDRRLEFRDLVFNPRPYDTEDAATPFEMNLFTGLAFVPNRKRYTKDDMAKLRDGPLKPFCDHMLDIIASGDTNLYDYVMHFVRATLITPWRKLRTCIVFRGDEGLGKGTVLSVLESCLGSKYVSKPSDLDAAISGFNAAELEGKLLMFLDEAVFGGCKKSTGKLKKLITENYLQSEQKYCERRTIENCMSVMMASNEDHVVQAGKNSRRWVVLECSNRLAGSATTESQAYFAKVRATDCQLLVNYLNSLPGADVWDECAIPSTAGTTVQRKQSLRPVQKFLLDFLTDPSIIADARYRSGFVTEENDEAIIMGEYGRNALYNIFLRHTQADKYRPPQAEFIQAIKKDLDATTPSHQRTLHGERTRLIELPSLTSAREAFKAATGMDHHVFE